MPKVLIIEDMEVNARMLGRRLGRHGYEVAIAEDGAQGIAKAVSESPDVILVDLALPDMTGHEVIRTLKGQPETCWIPIIVLSAHSMEEDRGQAEEAGCDDYETKPTDLPRLLDKLGRLTRRN